jgi:hypothetical protein
VAGAIPEAELQRELVDLLQAQRLRLLGSQPFERRADSKSVTSFLAGAVSMS